MTRYPAPGAPAKTATCGRCGRPCLPQLRRWPEGLICSGCYVSAIETHGSCAGCGTVGLVPGRGTNGDMLCLSCAGIGGNHTCKACHREAMFYTAGTCGNCVLSQRLAVLLDDGTGRIRAELEPLHAKVASMPRPRTGLLWISKPHVPPLLRALATGQVPLTHEGLSTLTPWRAVIHLRDLLIDAEVLPPVDRFLFLLEQWIRDWLPTIADVEHRKTLERFATWQLLRRLRAVAATGPIGYGRQQNAQKTLTCAAGFLAHLAGRGRSIATCAQADIDSWHAANSSGNRWALRPFLRWCQTHGDLSGIELPLLKTGNNLAPISQTQRLEVVARLMTDDQLPLMDRIVAMLILLFAQPVSRIIRLTLDDVLTIDGELHLRLGDPTTPVPEPFAELLRTYLLARPNLTGAANPGSNLLFPGRRAGQPLHPTSLRMRLYAAGIPNITGRTAALRQLLLQAPAAVVAGMLGYGPQTAEKKAAEAGAVWKNYAPGGHAW